MTIEITHASIENHLVRILANDVSEEHYQRILRTRDDFDERELEFIFDLDDKRQYRYLYRFLKGQKAVQRSKPKYLREALNATIGTVTDLSGAFVNWDAA